jgi:3-methyladenine DNA glycosylase AlkD
VSARRPAPGLASETVAPLITRMRCRSRGRRVVAPSPNTLPTTTLKKALKQLETCGDEKIWAHNAKNGAGENQFGVKRGDIRKIADKIKSDHELALALWDTGYIDAQFLATLVIKPKNLFAERMDRMVRSITFDWVADWLNNYVVAQHPEKEALRQKWMAVKEKHPMAARAGWRLTADRVEENPDGLFLDALLKRIEAEMAKAAPQVQWTMNSTLAQIGIHFPNLRQRAIAIGEKLGIYRDYPVSKGCTSPFAPIWVNFMVARQK